MGNTSGGQGGPYQIKGPTLGHGGSDKVNCPTLGGQGGPNQVKGAHVRSMGPTSGGLGGHIRSWGPTSGGQGGLHQVKGPTSCHGGPHQVKRAPIRRSRGLHQVMGAHFKRSSGPASRCQGGLHLRLKGIYFFVCDGTTVIEINTFLCYDVRM